MITPNDKYTTPLAIATRKIYFYRQISSTSSQTYIHQWLSLFRKSQSINLKQFLWQSWHKPSQIHLRWTLIINYSILSLSIHLSPVTDKTKISSSESLWLELPTRNGMRLKNFEMIWILSKNCNKIAIEINERRSIVWFVMFVTFRVILEYFIWKWSCYSIKGTFKNDL